jgi:hypothetical protein
MRTRLSKILVVIAMLFTSLVGLVPQVNAVTRCYWRDGHRVCVHRRSTGKRVAIIGGSAAGGALIGGLAGGAKGGAIGALVGGAGGAIYDAKTHKKVVVH